MAKRRLYGKRAIVTGASSGLGFQIAKLLANHGMHLVLNARSKELLEHAGADIISNGGSCEIVVGDVTDSNLQHRLISTCVEKFGGIDCLINNAGVTAMGRFDQADKNRIRKIFELNVFAVTELIHQAIPYLNDGDDPLIVNIGSVLGHRAVPLKSEYCASKFALHGFTDALRAELSSGPIEVLLVSPSTIDSKLFDSAIDDSTGKNWKNSSAMQPVFVAQQTVKAMIRRKHEIILPTSGKLLVWLDRLMPGLANRLIARFGQ